MEREIIILEFEELGEKDLISDIREGRFEYLGEKYKQIAEELDYYDLEKEYETKKHIFKRESDEKFFLIAVSWAPRAYDEIDSTHLVEVFEKIKQVKYYE